MTRLVDQFHFAFVIVVATLNNTAPAAMLVKNNQFETQLIHARCEFVTSAITNAARPTTTRAVAIRLPVFDRSR